MASSADTDKSKAPAVQGDRPAAGSETDKDKGETKIKLRRCRAIARPQAARRWQAARQSRRLRLWPIG
eukprot:9786087-Alexandrium_andersonii.AAC.1